MIYKIIDGQIQGVMNDIDYPKMKNEENIFWMEKFMPEQIETGFDEILMQPITTPNTYTLTYTEKLDSLRFKRGWLLQKTDCGMVTDCPLSEEQKRELHDYRQSLRDFSKDVTEENIDTYKLPDAPEWAITWFKL